MSGVVEAALAAHAAKEEAARLQREADAIRAHQEAYEQIRTFALSNLGIEVMPNQMVAKALSFQAEVKLTDDATVVFNVHTTGRHRGTVTAHVKPHDQLYWDLPPEFETFDQYRDATGRGASYGCYRLSKIADELVADLAGVGEKLARIAKAREEWNEKHGCPVTDHRGRRCVYRKGHSTEFAHRYEEGT